MTSLYNLFSSKGQLFAFLFGLLMVALIFIPIVTGIGSAGYDTGTDFNQLLKADGNTETFEFFNMAVTIPRLMIGITLFLAVIFGIIQLISNPKGSLKFLLGLGLVFAMFFIFYSSGEMETGGRLGMLHGKHGVEEMASKIITGGIKTVGILFGGAIVVAVVMEVLNFFK